MIDQDASRIQPEPRDSTRIAANGPKQGYSESEIGVVG